MPQLVHQDYSLRFSGVTNFVKPLFLFMTYSFYLDLLKRSLLLALAAAAAPCQLTIFTSLSARLWAENLTMLHFLSLFRKYVIFYYNNGPLLWIYYDCMTIAIRGSAVSTKLHYYVLKTKLLIHNSANAHIELIEN